MSDIIDYKIFGDDMQLVEVELDPGEGVRAEAGAMRDTHVPSHPRDLPCAAYLRRCRSQSRPAAPCAKCARLTYQWADASSRLGAEGTTGVPHLKV